MILEKDEKFKVLSDDELDQAAGGYRDERGRMVITPLYGCNHYSVTINIGVYGSCSTCKHMYWEDMIMYCGCNSTF